MALAPFDAIIIGAGAAGLMCALTAGGRGRRVALLDHNDQAGAKILISGGGRCNFTNTGTTPQNFISQNPQFARSALSRYTPDDFLKLIAKHQIAWHEKTLGQLFCDGSARQIVKMLLDECAAAAVEAKLNCQITSVRKADQFVVETSQGEFSAPAVVLATGGLSIPKMGATGFAHQVAKQFGLKLVQTHPGLVPLRASPQELDFYTSLSGVSLPAIAQTGTVRFAESILFTHRGLSGPAVLQASSYLNDGAPLVLDLLPGQDAAQLLKNRKHNRPKAALKTVLAEVLPQRLAQSLGSEAAMETVPAATLAALAARLKQWEMRPAGTEGYAKAEVTTGGIDTDGLSSKTMEAKTVPGLYAIGEAVDVTGWLGGYNFQWAWASGHAAGEAL
ncbi:MAG: NAD(P)/FAD-dependent oxidoreductase [Alphaproteobacteria bacterium]|nr:NAD(P)/FAD-dependent oxidoreductase [Alphaproteobacteria bacterium]